jgi:U3 small nucleolar ribonucleoprotein component
MDEKFSDSEEILNEEFDKMGITDPLREIYLDAFNFIHKFFSLEKKNRSTGSSKTIDKN